MTEDFEGRSVPGGAGRGDPRHGDPAVTSIHDDTQGDAASPEAPLVQGDATATGSTTPTVDSVTERRDEHVASHDPAG